MSAMNVANAFTTLPTRIAGAINSFQCFAFANAAAVAGPPIPALEATKISREENKNPIANKWIAYIVHAKYSNSRSFVNA